MDSTAQQDSPVSTESSDERPLPQPKPTFLSIRDIIGETQDRKEETRNDARSAPTSPGDTLQKGKEDRDNHCPSNPLKFRPLSHTGTSNGASVSCHPSVHTRVYQAPLPTAATFPGGLSLLDNLSRGYFQHFPKV
ncbi:hypothetical protein BaRGS_00030196 [Batillaria attramentaria]|uniref:Uncharacterized protein n=1 Tax=Batillaria attramentaria TaxID=370345 RepID=A0ABD0JV08_9CAEN